MQVFVSKYALSAGRVDYAEAEPSSSGDDYVRVGPHGFYKLGRDCFTTKADAVADAEKRRKAKIVSLQKQIAKLERLSF